MKFVFITVNFNGSEHTQLYLDSIRALQLSDDDSLQTVIVDNDSRADELAKLQQMVDPSRNEQLQLAGSNVGYFPGLNIGLASVEKNDNAVVIVGNNDVQFATDFIQAIKNLHIDDDVFVLAPDITTRDGRKQNPHVIDRVGRLERVKADVYFAHYAVACLLSRTNSLIKKLVGRSAGLAEERQYPQMKIKRGIGACYVLLPAFFKQNSKLDDRVFLWGEEALFSHQVESTCGATLYTPTLKVAHSESASVSALVGRQRYQILKNSYKVYRQYL